MSRANFALRRVGVLAIIAVVAALAACADAPTAATTPAHRAPRAAVRDDPPDTPCFSGWVVVNGIWTCFDS